jgi:hypothetical protein
MTILFVLLAMAAIASVGLAAAGRLGALPEAQPDHRPAGDPTFDVVLRGYRMVEVDAVIEDLQRQLDERRDQT